MPAGWFLAPYRTVTDGRGTGRVNVIGDYSDLILADGGAAEIAECLGNMAVAKVRASSATLQTIAADPAIWRAPLGLLDDPVASLTAAQQQNIQNKLLSLGYTAGELNTAFPLGWTGPYLLRDVLRFALKRYLRSRLDTTTTPPSVVLDGPVEACRPLESLDVAVT